MHGYFREYSPQPFPPSLRDVVLRRKDGWPAYQLASVVDDEYFGVNLIVRGADLWPSTLAQLAIAQALGYEHFPQQRFLHHGLLLNEEGEKLSKSARERSLYQHIESGGGPELVYHRFAAWWGLPEAADDLEGTYALWQQQSPAQRREAISAR